MPVDVQIESEDPNLPTIENLQEWAQEALQDERREGELCIRLVGEDEGKLLNQQYRGGELATNVLSFGIDVDFPDQVLLGDVVICTSVVAAEAEQQNKSLQHHYAHMVVHGVLHLLGHDHQDDKQAQKMEFLEVQILDRLDVPDPYEVHQ